MSDPTRPHDHAREFAAWLRLCAAIYEVERAATDLGCVAQEDIDRADAGKLAVRMQKVFEDRWRTYGWRLHQARDKGR